MSRHQLSRSEKTIRSASAVFLIEARCGCLARSRASQNQIACPAHHRRNRGVEARTQRHEAHCSRHVLILRPFSVGRPISVEIDTAKGAA
jgi:hypothetical protein